MKHPPASLGWRMPLHRFLSGYGMLLVLLVLCAYYSWVTWAEQNPAGTHAAQLLARDLARHHRSGTRVLIIAGSTPDDVVFAQTLRASLEKNRFSVLAPITGEPVDARRALDKLSAAQAHLDLIACTAVTANWALLQHPPDFPCARDAKVVQAGSYWWPNFLKSENLLNVANQIVVIALVAIGMTVVIIAGGIDLSVGSLIALSAVLSTELIRDYAGAERAQALGMLICCVTGIAACAAVGLLSGVFVTQLGIPPFIVTLGTMLIASGLAFIWARGQSIYQVPDSFIWLGRGAGWFGLPNAVWLMLIMYVLGYLLMERTALGRYVYAIGGNREAALLSGVPVKRVVLFSYVLSGALAGLGGVVTASQLKSGAPTYGVMYELYVIAAVVVGGTSLLGGEGQILGTLIGAFIIAVIQNGMNLTGVESYTQKVVLGCLILAAVVLDRVRKLSLDRLLIRRD
jgi:ribose transport system permease protein